MRLTLALAAALCLTAPLAAQDVFIGGRVDLELQLADDVRGDFGRLAGVDLTFRKPGTLDVYFDFTLAGGDGRVQEFYLSLPQTRKVVDVSVGRILIPHAAPRTAFEDRYVAGGPDFFDTYGAWRRGNVLLDTDGLGVRLMKQGDRYEAELMGGLAPGDDDGEGFLAGRLLGKSGDVSGGLSGFVGRTHRGRDLAQGVLFFDYEGERAEFLGQFFFGEAGRLGHTGWSGRAGFRPGGDWLLFLAQTSLESDAARRATTTRLGVQWDFAEDYWAEVRHEFNDGPGADDLTLFRLGAIF